MKRKIKCNSKPKNERVRVRVIRAPIVNSDDLRGVIMARSRAIVL